MLNRLSRYAGFPLSGSSAFCSPDGSFGFWFQDCRTAFSGVRWLCANCRKLTGSLTLESPAQDLGRGRLATKRG